MIKAIVTEEVFDWGDDRPPGRPLADSIIYEIHIKGRMSAQLLAAFEGMDATVQSVETVLRGPVVDQAALHGLLDRIQALGLELVEVRRLPEPGDQR